MFKVLTRRATIPLVTVRLLLSPPACGTVEGLKARSHMTIGMTTGLQTYANYLAAHWLTVYQWS